MNRRVTTDNYSGWRSLMFTTNLLYIFFAQLFGFIFDLIRTALGL